MNLTEESELKLLAALERIEAAILAVGVQNSLLHENEGSDESQPPALEFPDAYAEIERTQNLVLVMLKAARDRAS
jgi:hypothetical protein